MTGTIREIQQIPSRTWTKIRGHVGWVWHNGSHNCVISLTNKGCLVFEGNPAQWMITLDPPSTSGL